MPIEILNIHDHDKLNLDEFDLLIYGGRTSSYPRAKRWVGKRLVDCSKWFGNYSEQRTAKSFKPYFDKQLEVDRPTMECLNRLALRAVDEKIGLFCHCAPKGCHLDYVKQRALELHSAI